MKLSGLICSSLTGLMLLMNSSQASAKAPVWKVSRGDDYLYLGGTIHVLSKKDYPLPKAFDVAFNSADELIFEIDERSLNSPSAQALFSPLLTYDDARTLESELSPSVYLLLRQFLEQRHLGIDAFNNFTPAGISLTLTMMELHRLGIIDPSGESPGVDSYYSKRGLAVGKQIAALETLQDQISFLMSLNNEDSDQIIRSNLRDLENLQSMWKDLLEAWRSGDLQQLEEIGIKPLLEFPRVLQVLLIQRNNNWLKKIKPMLASKEIEFVLVGALHMGGEFGLIRQLTDAGYTVEQLD
jgi:uncharacterized protein YbaP (TraB family)